MHPNVYFRAYFAITTAIAAIAIVDTIMNSHRDPFIIPNAAPVFSTYVRCRTPFMSGYVSIGASLDAAICFVI